MVKTATAITRNICLDANNHLLIAGTFLRWTGLSSLVIPSISTLLDAASYDLCQAIHVGLSSFIMSNTLKSRMPLHCAYTCGIRLAIACCK